MEKTKINIEKKNATNRYLKSLLGGPHGEKNMEKHKKCLKSLWGGPHGETKKRLEKQKNIFEESLGRAPWRKPAKNGKPKKNTNILRLLAYPSPSPRLLFFFSGCFSKFFVFFPKFFWFSLWGPSQRVSKKKIKVFPECVARVPVSLWGSGG